MLSGVRLLRAPFLAVFAIAIVVVVVIGRDGTSALPLASASPSAARMEVRPVVAGAQAEPSTTLPEAPSSITAKDQTRGALVLFATFAAMGLLVLFAVIGARRRRRRTPA